LLCLVLGCAPSPQGERDGGPPDAVDDPPSTPPPLLPCGSADGEGTPGFCDVTAQWGLAEGSFDALPTTRDEGRSGYLSAADFDGDEHPDLFLTDSASGRPALLLWRAGGFVNATAAWNLPAMGGIQGTAVADFDGDGHPDLALGPGDGEAVSLYRNEGTRFAAEPVQLAFSGGRLVAALLPWDLDRDGRLDLLVGSYRRSADCQIYWGNGCPGDLLAFRQSSTWRFEPIAVSMAPRRVQGIRIFDWDDDGRDEVLIAADFGMFEAPNAILRLEVSAGGALALRDEGGGSGFDVAMFGMGIAALDVDGDGRDEVLLPNIGPQVLLRREAGRGRDVAAALGAAAYGVAVPGERPTFRYFDPESPREGPLARYQAAYLRPTASLFPTASWAAVVLDFDDDGVSDVFLPMSGNGLESIFPVLPRQQSVLLRGTGRRMVDATAAMRLGQRHDTTMAVAADFDADGDLDLALMLEATTGVRGGLQVLRNDASTGRSLAVRARGRGAARDGIGAWVEIRSGDRRARQRVDGNLSLSGSGPHEAHFGLGAADHVDELVVRFPSGAVVRRAGVPAGRVVVEEE